MVIARVTGTTSRVRGMFYGWFMAGLGALIMALGCVPLWGGLPIWNPVLRNTFGWTAGQMSWGHAVTQAESGFLGPVVGVLTDKLGPRRMVFIGLIILGSGFVLFSLIRELWHLYVVFLIMSFGSSMSTWLPMMTVVNHWFVRRRNKAMALVMEGFAVAGIIVPLLLAWAIGGIDPDVSERYGWRNTARFIGILSLASAIPLSLLVRNRPEDLGLEPDGDSSVPATTSLVNAGISHSEKEEQGYTWQDAIRTKAFWLISLGHAFSSMFLSTVFVHMGLMLDDRGFSVQTIGTVVAIFTAASAIFILVGGYLGDRFSMRMVAFGFSVIQPLSAVVLVLAHSMGMLFLFAVLFGIGWGGRTPVMSALRGAYFGRNAFATITGISMVPLNILLFSGPVFAGLMRDATGSFDSSFLTIAAVTLLGSCLFLSLEEPPRLCEPGTSISQSAD